MQSLHHRCPNGNKKDDIRPTVVITTIKHDFCDIGDSGNLDPQPAALKFPTLKASIMTFCAGYLGPLSIH